jgi:hypothetical protein
VFHIFVLRSKRLTVPRTTLFHYLNLVLITSAGCVSAWFLSQRFVSFLHHPLCTSMSKAWRQSPNRRRLLIYIYIYAANTRDAPCPINIYVWSLCNVVTPSHKPEIQILITFPITCCNTGRDNRRRVILDSSSDPLFLPQYILTTVNFDPFGTISRIRFSCCDADRKRTVEQDHKSDLDWIERVQRVRSALVESWSRPL